MKFQGINIGGKLLNFIIEIAKLGKKGSTPCIQLYKTHVVYFLFKL